MTVGKRRSTRRVCENLLGGVNSNSSEILGGPRSGEGKHVCMVERC